MLAASTNVMTRMSHIMIRRSLPSTHICTEPTQGCQPQTGPKPLQPAHNLAVSGSSSKNATVRTSRESRSDAPAGVVGSAKAVWSENVAGTGNRKAKALF